MEARYGLSVTAASDRTAAKRASYAETEKAARRGHAEPLTAAAGEYDRAARELWGRVPAPSQAGQGLRAASVLLASARFVGRHENKQLLALLAQLAALSDAVTRLRENQDRAAQAAAARSSAEQLRLTSAQRASLQAGSPAATTTRTRQPGVSFDAGRPRPGPDGGTRRPAPRTPPVAGSACSKSDTDPAFPARPAAIRRPAERWTNARVDGPADGRLSTHRVGSNAVRHVDDGGPGIPGGDRGSYQGEGNAYATGSRTTTGSWRVVRF